MSYESNTPVPALMLAIATTTVTIYAEDTVNEYGDPVADNDVVLYEGIPISVIEITQTSEPPVDRMDRTYRSYTARVPRGIELRRNMRFKDERSPEEKPVFYKVTQVVDPRNSIYFGDTRVDLTSVD